MVSPSPFLREQIVKEKTLSLTGMVGIFPAATVGGEDVEVYANESRCGEADAEIAKRPARPRGDRQTDETDVRV